MPNPPFTLLIGAVTAFFVSAWPSSAAAVSRFPRSITSDLSLSYEPPCRLCHIEGTTGPGSVQTPFGVSMHAHGLTSDRNTLTPALDALRAENVDSDGDGVSDIDELIANTDPNTPVAVQLSSGDPSYGCEVASSSNSGHKSGTTLVSIISALAIACVRCRSRRSDAI